MIERVKKNWQNIIFVLVLILLFIPQTGFPIKVFVNRLISFGPTEVVKEKQFGLSTYNWTLQNLEGEVINFEKSEGKVILLNIWATWCPPCVAEMPSLQRLYDAYGDRVAFYFVSNETPEKLHRFMNKKGYDFPVYIPKGMAPENLSSNSLPTTYVISKQGKILIEKMGAADWETESTKKLLDRLLAQ